MLKRRSWTFCAVNFGAPIRVTGKTLEIQSEVAVNFGASIGIFGEIDRDSNDDTTVNGNPSIGCLKTLSMMDERNTSHPKKWFGVAVKIAVKGTVHFCPVVEM